jgi:pre-mRNA cleavage complex 2 protein Pcf11
VLESYSAMQYAEDPDQQETYRSLTGTIRATSPHLLSANPFDVNPDGLLTNSRRNLSRAPPLDLLHRNVSPKRMLKRPPPSHSIMGPDPRRLPDRNGRPRWAFDDSGRPTTSVLDEEYRKQSARELIDAYGNCQGRDADERLPKMQHLASNGMASKSTAHNWLNAEEEEYSWEDMSPTLTDRNRNSMPSFPGVNAGLLEPNIRRNSYPSQTPRPSGDGASLNIEDRISATGVCLSYLSLITLNSKHNNFCACNYSYV